MSSKFADAQTLAGKYVINRPIGTGSFARVYEATDLKVGRRVAIKVLSSRFGQVIERFAREIALIKDLEHPNITRLYDFDTTPDGAPFIVMELVEGVELGALVQAEGRLPVKRVVALAMQIVDALAEAHGQGIIHCDLKPENILVCAKGARQDVVQILDFGISALTAEAGGNESTESEGLVGTPSYMSPEQIRQQNLGPWTDLYALGLIIIEMMTGQRVFDGDSAHEILRRQLKEEVTIPEIVKNSPLVRIVERTVAKDYRQRYQTAREMYLALDEANAQLVATVTSQQVAKLPDFDPFAVNTSGLELEQVNPISYSLSVAADGSIMSRLDDLKNESNQSRTSSGSTPAAAEAPTRPRPPKPEPVEAKPFKLELDPDAVQRINESRRRAEVFKPQQGTSLFGLWLVLAAIVVIGLGGVVYWHQFMRAEGGAVPAKAAQAKDPQPSGQAAAQPAAIPAVPGSSGYESTKLRSALQASSVFGSTGAHAGRLPVFKLIISPFDAQTFAGTRRICTRTPCKLAVIGSKAMISVQAARFEEGRFELTNDAKKQDQTIMVELEAR